MVTNRTVQVDGLSVASTPRPDVRPSQVLLLGGFPHSSHQFRNLIPRRSPTASTSFLPTIRVSATPRCPGASSTPSTGCRRSSRACSGRPASTPSGSTTRITAARSAITIVSRHPDWLEWQVIQGEHHEEGFTAAWDGIRHALWVDRSPETEAPLLPFLSSTASARLHTRAPRPGQDQPRQLEHGHPLPRAHGCPQGQKLDLLYDYRTNVALYPQWQAFLRERKPRR